MQAIETNQRQKQHSNYRSTVARLLIYAAFARLGVLVVPVLLVEFWGIPDQTGVLIFTLFVVCQLWYVFQDMDPLEAGIRMIGGLAVYLLLAGVVVWIGLIIPELPPYETGLYTSAVLVAAAFVASDVGGDLAKILARK